MVANIQLKRREVAERPKGETPLRERRSKNRVADDQGTGKGSGTALSKLRMLERRRASISPRSESDGKD